MINEANTKEQNWNYLKDGSQKSNPERLKELVYKMIHIMLENGAENRNNIEKQKENAKKLDDLYRKIILESTCLVLDDRYKEVFKNNEL